MTENDDDLCEWRTDMNHGIVWSQFREDTMAKHSAAKADDLSAIETAASGMNLFPVKWNVIDDPLGFGIWVNSS